MGEVMESEGPRERVLTLLRTTQRQLEATVPETTKSLLKRSEHYFEEAKKIIVRSKPTYDLALELEKDIKGIRAEVADVFKEPKKLGRAIWQFFVKREKDLDSPLAYGERAIKQKRTKWFIEEQKRAEKKKRKKQEELRLQAEEKKKEQVEELRELGEEEAAEELESIDVEIGKVEVTNRAKEKGSGASFAKKWYAEVVDINKLDRKYMIADISKLNHLAQASDGQNPPAGVVFKFKIISRTRA